MGDHSYQDSESVAHAVALHHYSKNFRGFLAMLTPEQAQKLVESDSVISVFRSRMNQVYTTHSWDLGNRLYSLV
ncbi:hypothetical protein VitviT2T_019890 [Vitis vinifera]|uniref:Inhibitor I9 domain-containing protein n=1 Tax=Vitis vinifera TaxID=29760 RepID=A0ABY9D3Y2_VITVI|nr:hypothetical protein VitviT2T_019890 [Vitis vinifera]